MLAFYLWTGRLGQETFTLIIVVCYCIVEQIENACNWQRVSQLYTYCSKNKALKAPNPQQRALQTNEALVLNWVKASNKSASVHDVEIYQLIPDYKVYCMYPIGKLWRPNIMLAKQGNVILPIWDRERGLYAPKGTK